MRETLPAWRNCPCTSRNWRSNCGHVGSGGGGGGGGGGGEVNAQYLLSGSSLLMQRPEKQGSGRLPCAAHQHCGHGGAHKISFCKVAFDCGWEP
jgi:hypothetical protein